MDMKRCDLCWAKGPPYIWEKAFAKTIPATRAELIAELQDFVEHETLVPMNRDELKHMFRKLVRGESHPQDCTKGMTNLNKSELVQIVSDHGLSTRPADLTKGHMQSLLRDHWKIQCQLALMQGGRPTTSSDTGESWDVVAPGGYVDDAKIALKQYQSLKESMSDVLKNLFSQCEKKTSNKHIVDNAAKAFEQFLNTMECLEATVSDEKPC